jgi:hypothetical protein
MTRFGEGFLRIKAPLFAVEITMIALYKPLDESMMIDAKPKPERPEHLSVETEWWGWHRGRGARDSFSRSTAFTLTFIAGNTASRS